LPRARRRRSAATELPPWRAPNPVPSSYVCERISTTGISSTYSNHQFASSSPPAPGTP
jgi:hypothetical protein